MFPEQLQAIRVDLNGIPGMGLHEVGKIPRPLFHGQFTRAAIKMLADPAQGTRVGVNGLFALALEFE